MTYKTKQEILENENILSNSILLLIEKRFEKLKITFEYNKNMILNPDIRLSEKSRIIKEISEKQNVLFVKKMGQLEKDCLTHEKSILQFALEGNYQ